MAQGLMHNMLPNEAPVRSMTHFGTYDKSEEQHVGAPVQHHAWPRRSTPLFLIEWAGGELKTNTCMQGPMVGQAGLCAR